MDADTFANFVTNARYVAIVVWSLFAILVLLIMYEIAKEHMEEEKRRKKRQDNYELVESEELDSGCKVCKDESTKIEIPGGKHNCQITGGREKNDITKI